MSGGSETVDDNGDSGDAKSVTEFFLSSAVVHVGPTISNCLPLAVAVAPFLLSQHGGLAQIIDPPVPPSTTDEFVSPATLLLT